MVSRSYLGYPPDPLFNLESSEGQPLTPPLNNDPVNSLVIRLLLHTRAEANSTHDTVTELLIHDRLVRISVVLHNLVQSVDERVLGRHVEGSASVGPGVQLLLQLRLVEVEKFSKGLDVGLRGFSLTVEDCGAGYFVAAEGLGDLLEGELLLLLSLEEGGA